MNMTCRSLEPSVEPNEPNVRSTEVGLNTIMPVIRAFTAMDVAKLVIVNVFPQGAVTLMSCSNVNAPSDAIQIARCGTLESAY